MIAYVKHNNVVYPAIVMECIETPDDVRTLRKALVDIMETCVSNEDTKDITSSTSLWYLTRLIDETTIECHKNNNNQNQNNNEQK